MTSRHAKILVDGEKAQHVAEERGETRQLQAAPIPKQHTNLPSLTCSPPAKAFSYMAACCSSGAFERSSARRARPHSWPTQGQLRTARAYTALMTAGQVGRQAGTQAQVGEFGVHIGSNIYCQAVRPIAPAL
jgi:hypothetical protein